MAQNFVARREAETLAREAALRNSGTNPARVVERSSLATVASSEEATQLSLSYTSVARSASGSATTYRAKGKEPLNPNPRTKRTRKGDKAKASQKRLSQGCQHAGLRVWWRWWPLHPWP